ncbi:bifunctional riboflavin kinase/FAD synthetase [Salinarimonas chemoclinalis]|uniref:bifunctional riboflavin kinase/FAD synthetase n=1 Tax=Salinarimonas chemoclinalis TaxID=3241599 RepID=UPI0035579D99
MTGSPPQASPPSVSTTHVDPAPGRRGPVVVIGNFDGVHRGHRTLLADAREKAAARGVGTAVLTFEPHPRAFFSRGEPFFRITPRAEKERVLARVGVDAVHVRAFDAGLAGMSPEAFVDELLVGALDASGVVVGYDFHFGKGRAGTPAVLTRLCAERGIGCDVVPVVEEAGAPVSSSAIRAALAAGDVARANALLGYRWFVLGEVRHGDKRGRTLGYPTANMALAEGCGLAHGIYAVRLSADGVVRDGVASFGRRPTFDDGAPLLETFVFDFTGDLYGKTVGVEFAGFIRGEERFESAQALIAQMDRDSARAKEMLAARDGLDSML